jgi:serine/threonine protein kinase
MDGTADATTNTTAESTPHRDSLVGGGEAAVGERRSTNLRMIGNYTEQFLIEKAKEEVERRTKTWEIATLRAEDRVQRLRRDEIELGRELGKGGFFAVTEIKKITLRGDVEDGTETSDVPVSVCDVVTDDDDFTGVVQNRKFMEKNCIRKGKNPRYCFKTMQDHCKEDPKLFVNTMIDLVIEAKFLANVRHPNIIKMRAMSEGFISSGDDFIVLDKLYGTLETKIEQWKESNTNSIAKLFDFRRKHEKSFLAERLTVAYDVGSALSYLHDRKYVSTFVVAREHRALIR